MKTVEDHQKYLKEVFVTLLNANWILTPKKCQLFQRQLVYLGQVIGVCGTAPEPRQKLRNGSFLRQWGLSNPLLDCLYNRRLFKKFASIAKPLHYLTEQSARLVWTPAQQVSFDQLRLEIVMPVMWVLGLSNENNGVDRHLVLSLRVLRRTEMKYSTTKREALALIQALKWYRPYLLGVPFVLRTDHASLRWMFRQDAEKIIFPISRRILISRLCTEQGINIGNADDLSRGTSEELEWAPRDREGLTSSCPQPVFLEVTLTRTRESRRMIRENGGRGANSEEDALEAQAIVWSRETPDGEKMQEDKTIRRVFLWLSYNPGGEIESFQLSYLRRSSAAWIRNVGILV